MTFQTQERLIFNGETEDIEGEPLDSYLSNLKDKPDFMFMGSDCWRGYVGTWELIGDKLYLIDLKGYISNDKNQYRDVDMGFLFPHQKKVFAEWFTGEIKIQKGKAYRYSFRIYTPIFEWELILVFDKGYIIGQRTVDNYEEIEKILASREKERIKNLEEEQKRERKERRKLIFKRIIRLLSGGGTASQKTTGADN